MKQKIKASHVTKLVLKRAAHPGHLWQAFQLQRNRKRNSRSLEDIQLKLYSEILPSDFLHFGYFESPSISPQDISINEMVAAQGRYADLLLAQVEDRQSPILDIGCGMGGMCRLMLERKMHPVALSPDRLQVNHIRQKYPQVPVIHSKFEVVAANEYAGTFGTVITSESLQYLKLDKSLPLLAQIVKPGGRWIACDFFFREPTSEKTCHYWDDFVQQTSAARWTITLEQDITQNVLPTLRFVHLLAARFGIPLMRYAFLRFRRKQPGLHHILENLLSGIEQMAQTGIQQIDPVAFESRHKYMLVVLERAN